MKNLITYSILMGDKYQMILITLQKRMLKNFLVNNPNFSSRRMVVLSSQAAFPSGLQNSLSMISNKCGAPEKFQSLSDLVLFKLNPLNNSRRVATWRFICE